MYSTMHFSEGKLKLPHNQLQGVSYSIFICDLNQSNGNVGFVLFMCGQI